MNGFVRAAPRFLLLVVLLAALVAACAEDPVSPVPPQPSPGDGPAAEVIVIDSLLDENRYRPDEVAAPAGTEVTIQFRNGSGVEHTLTFDEPIGADTGIVAPGAGADITFTIPDPGRYRFACQIHPQMEGELVVL